MSDRFDYEGVDSRAAYSLMRDLEAVITDKALPLRSFLWAITSTSVEKADNFEYVDPVDGSVSRKQVSPNTSREHERCSKNSNVVKYFLYSYILKYNLFLSSVSNDPSEIIVICWFAAQETFLNIINAKNSCAAYSFWALYIILRIIWWIESSKKQHLYGI